jgi:hypothetical protein
VTELPTWSGAGELDHALNAFGSVANFLDRIEMVRPLLPQVRRMADLEEHAFKRDKRFVVRLVLTLIVALLGGVFIYGRLTNQGTASCAAGAFL